MKIIFTKGNSILSKLICWGLNEPVSHVAFVFDDKIVFHSNLLGLHIEWFNTFKKKCQIIFEIDYNTDLENEEDIYQEVISINDGKSYDFAAFFYFIWRGFLYKFFNKPIPIVNKWNNEHQDLCVEVIRYFNKQLPIKDLSIISPYKLYLILKEEQHG